MTVAETLAHKVRQLPVDRQLQVLEYVEFLEQKHGQRGPRRDPEGLLAEQPSNLNLGDFTAARREAWRGFPREGQR